MDLTIATAPVTWGIRYADDPQQMEWSRCLDEIAAAGYEWLEPGPVGYIPGGPAGIGAELKQRGLRLCGGMVQMPLEDRALWPEIETATRTMCELLAALGAGTFVIIDGRYSDPETNVPLVDPLLDDAGWADLMEEVNRLARIATNDYGLKAAFHPHSDTHVEFQPEIDHFLAESDPELISICFDTGHHAYCGGDPTDFMRRHHERVSYLHLKNIDAELRARVDRENISYIKAVAQGVFVEPDKGAVDFDEFRAVLEAVEFAGVAVVEQDMYPAPPDRPLGVARRTREYLRAHGYG